MFKLLPSGMLSRLLIAFSLFLVILMPSGSLKAAYFKVARVSVSSGGTQGNSISTRPALSANGRFVAFVSLASDLVAGDTNGLADIFVHDRTTGEIERVSVASDGSQSNFGSRSPDISGDGRYVVFASEASNLVVNDTNSRADIFVHDRETGQTTRISVALNGTQGDGISDDPAITPDGRYVTFESDSTTLVAGDTNTTTDVFVHDRYSGNVTRVSVDSSGTLSNGTSSNPAISADGQIVAFSSFATNLASTDTNGFPDIFVHYLQTGQTVHASIDSGGGSANGFSDVPSLSADGRFVAFESTSSDLVAGDTNSQYDVFVRDLTLGQTMRITAGSTQGDDDSASPEISADGKLITFYSEATNLIVGDTNAFADIFLYNRAKDTLTRISTAEDGTQGNQNSFEPAISDDGNVIGYSSQASNLVSGDTNGAEDIFVVDLLGPTFASLYRPSTSTFILRDANAASANEVSVIFSGVSVAARPIIGDWDGDGTDSVGLFDNGTFYLKNVNTTAAPIAYTIAFGLATDIPVAGDWDGDGMDTIGLYRPSLGVYYLTNSLSDTSNLIIIQFGDGVLPSLPLSGDWDRDGRDTLGTYFVWNDYNLTFLTNTTTSGSIGNPDTTIAYGAEGDLVFMGDWDGDGLDTPAVLRASDGTVYLKNSNTNGIADFWYTLGVPGDIPVAGYFEFAAPDQPSQSAPIFVPRD